MENTKKVAIIMGSDSDWPTVKAAAAQLKSWDIPVSYTHLTLPTNREV